MNSNAIGHGRRRFLMDAAGLAAVPWSLVSRRAAHRANEPRTPLAPACAPPQRANPVTAATTVTGDRTLGSLEVSSLGLGCQTMPGKLCGRVTSRADMVTLIRTAVDQGVTFFDTAEAYGPFESERIVGEALDPSATR